MFRPLLTQGSVIPMPRRGNEDERQGQAAPSWDAVDQLRALAGHLQSVREEERSRIAREIHDELGQALTALKMDLAWLQARLTRATEEEWVLPLLAKAQSMSELLDRAVREIRRIATELPRGAGQPRLRAPPALQPRLNRRRGVPSRAS